MTVVDVVFLRTRGNHQQLNGGCGVIAQVMGVLGATFKNHKIACGQEALLSVVVNRWRALENQVQLILMGMEVG
ncbi:MAG: hypothetical protein VX793_03185 [Pseudomonadota bacterium]|nr:hypothetical protein [Pseudomonadota bacterium]